MLPTVYALSQTTNDSNHSTTESLRETGVAVAKESVRMSDLVLKWLGNQVGVGVEYESQSGLSFAKDVLARGLVIVCAGAALYVLKEGSVALWDYLRKQFTLTVVVG